MSTNSLAKHLKLSKYTKHQQVETKNSHNSLKS